MFSKALFHCVFHKRSPEETTCEVDVSIYFGCFCLYSPVFIDHGRQAARSSLSNSEVPSPSSNSQSLSVELLFNPQHSEEHRIVKHHAHNITDSDGHPVEFHYDEIDGVFFVEVRFLLGKAQQLVIYRILHLFG